jgi:hypothetical protein
MRWERGIWEMRYVEGMDKKRKREERKRVKLREK